MLSEFEADTARYILERFGVLLVLLKENKNGCSVLAQYRAASSKEAWAEYRKIVLDTRARLKGALIGGEIIEAKEGFIMIVEIY